MLEVTSRLFAKFGTRFWVGVKTTCDRKMLEFGRKSVHDRSESLPLVVHGKSMGSDEPPGTKLADGDSGCKHLGVAGRHLVADWNCFSRRWESVVASYGTWQFGPDSAVGIRERV